MARTSTPHSVYVMRRIGLLTGFVSLLVFPALAFTLDHMMPFTARSMAPSVLLVAPYGVALSIAALCVAQHLTYRQRAKRSSSLRSIDYLASTTVHTIIWIAAVLISIPLTAAFLGAVMFMVP